MNNKSAGTAGYIVPLIKPLRRVIWKFKNWRWKEKLVKLGKKHGIDEDDIV